MWHAALIMAIYNCKFNTVRPHMKGKHILYLHCDLTLVVEEVMLL